MLWCSDTTFFLPYFILLFMSRSYNEIGDGSNPNNQDNLFMLMVKLFCLIDVRLHIGDLSFDMRFACTIDIFED
jgi:hypothetical protein